MTIRLSDLSPKARKQALRKMAGQESPARTPPPPRNLIASPPDDHLERSLLKQIRFAGLPTPVEQHRFAPPRKFRFDGCWPGRKLAYEVDGATWSGGRHVRGAGVEQDALKASLAAVKGWRVMRFTGAMVEDGTALKLIEEALKTGGNQ